MEKQLHDNIADIFIRKNDQDPDTKQQIENLYKEIGRIQVENFWLKKSSTISLELKVLFIDKGDLKLSIRQQCALRGSTGRTIVSASRRRIAEAEHRLRKAIDRQFMDDPCGVIKMMHYLRRLGHTAGEGSSAG